MISMIMSNFSTLQAKAIAFIVMAIIIFSAGWTVNGWRYEAKLKDQLAEQLALKDKVDRDSRKLISDLQDKLSKNQTDKVKRDAKIKDVTSGRLCFDNANAIQLWNDAFISEPNLSESTPRASKETARASATDEEVLENINENAARWKECRDQVNAIIEWDKSTFK